MSSKTKRVMDSMGADMKSKWRNLVGACLTVPMVVVVANANAATGIIINGGSATMSNALGTTTRYDSFLPIETHQESVVLTQVDFTVTPTNRTVWFEMTPGFESLNEDFKFVVDTADGATFSKLWIDIWKPGGTVEAPYAPSGGNHVVYGPVPDEGVWGALSSNEGFGTPLPVPVSYAEASVANGERETVIVQVDQTNDATSVGTGKTLTVDMSGGQGDFGVYPDGTWYGFNDFGSYDPNSPVWFLGLSVDGPEALMTMDDLVGTGYAAVPIPAAFWMFGSALLGVVAIRRQQRVAGEAGRG